MLKFAAAVAIVASLTNPAVAARSATAVEVTNTATEFEQSRMVATLATAYLAETYCGFYTSDADATHMLSRALDMIPAPELHARVNYLVFRILKEFESNPATGLDFCVKYSERFR